MAMVLLGANLGTWDWDVPTGRVLYNEHWAEMLGFHPDELEPYLASKQNLIHPDDNPEVQKRWQEHVEFKRDFYQADCRMKHCNGEWIWVQETGKIIERSRTGEPIRVCGTTKNVNSHKQLEEQLQNHRDELAHVSRLNTMGEMATGLAHEINQPLAAMSNYCYVGLHSLENGKASDPGFLEDLFKNLGDLTRRTAEIIRRLRDLVGKRPTVHAPVNILKPIREVIELLQPDLRRAEITVKVPEPNFELLALIDEIQIQQVLINLIRNAIDAMEQSSRAKVLEITAQLSEADLIQVSVIDTGRGILDENVDHVFDAFVTDKPGGLGMGLAISRTIIESHGGLLWMVPNAGDGMTCSFTVPHAVDDAEPAGNSQRVIAR